MISSNRLFRAVNAVLRAFGGKTALTPASTCFPRNRYSNLTGRIKYAPASFSAIFLLELFVFAFVTNH